MKETVTEQKVIEEEREVVICDYCRLFTSEDIDEDESFGKILLNPKTLSDNHRKYGPNKLELMAETFAGMDNPRRIHRKLVDTIVEGFDSDADLCPHCQEDLFGEGPASMRRDGEKL